LRTGVPVLFLHGTADRLVPFREGEGLFEGFPGKKALVVLEGAGHMSYLSHRDAYLEGFRAGLAELLGNVPW
jgi:pimeloyl-ACP methyl ester carboxylesterase